jgi:muramoyltetrapeptide carboxypeptidase
MSKHIYVYSPSGAVRDKAAFRRGVKRLTAMGHQVEVDEAALASHLRFAGDDATRLAGINRAAASGADVALISRGGYGLTRILGGIEYKQVARAIDKGMLFVGISDFTAFQSAVLARTGGVTWAGPALGEGFGMAAPALPDEIMAACFDDLLSGQGEGAGWRQLADAKGPVTDATKIIANKPMNTGPGATFDIKKSMLWGGNLTVLSSLLGSPYFPQVRKGLLFLEDVAEHPYRIERMLTQLLHAGVLGQQRAIILGQFTDFKLVPHDRGYKLATVVDWLRSQLKIPVLTNLPFGHVATKVLLPVGTQAQLLVDGRDAMLYWG